MFTRSSGNALVIGERKLTHRRAEVFARCLRFVQRLLQGHDIAQFDLDNYDPGRMCDRVDRVDRVRDNLRYL